MAQARIEQMMQMAAGKEEKENEGYNESQRSSLFAEVSTSLNTDRFIL